MVTNPSDEQYHHDGIDRRGYPQTIYKAEANKTMTNPDNVGGLRLFDSQWVNIVNHDNCYRDYTKEEAVAMAVKLTEQKMAENVELCRAAPAGGADTLRAAAKRLRLGVEGHRLADELEAMADSAPAGSGEVEALERNLVDAMNQIHRLDQARQRWIDRAVKMRRAYREQRDLLRALSRGVPEGST